MSLKKKDRFITKASGEVVKFSEEKLRNSLYRSGATEEHADNIVKEIRRRLYDGMSTRKIYNIAFKLLKENVGPTAAKYHLKRAIMELGPSGFPFEKYMGEILRFHGYNVRTGVIMKGRCVNHEVDVIATNAEEYNIIECKYHNLPGKVCDVKIPLYIQSRFKDIETVSLTVSKTSSLHHKGWVITNTRFTGDAIQYGNCAGLKLIGWNYPNGESLREIIDRSGLYPVTCLNTLTRQDKKNLLEKNVVLCREITSDVNLLINAGIKQSKVNIIMKEAQQLCDSLNQKNV